MTRIVIYIAFSVLLLTLCGCREKVNSAEFDYYLTTDTFSEYYSNIYINVKVRHSEVGKNEKIFVTSCNFESEIDLKKSERGVLLLIDNVVTHEVIVTMEGDDLKLSIKELKGG